MSWQTQILTNVDPLPGYNIEDICMPIFGYYCKSFTYELKFASALDTIERLLEADLYPDTAEAETLNELIKMVSDY